ncbi:MAG: YbaB/EbfC family nucleoid-associated protein [Phycisphaerae bacterium]
MFGNLGNLGKMMQVASEMKTKMPELQKKLAESEYTAEAGGGAVRATVSGKLQIRDVKIDPGVLEDGDVEMLEDLVKAAVSAAQASAAQAAAEAMKELTGGMKIPGMTDMLGM